MVFLRYSSLELLKTGALLACLAGSQSASAIALLESSASLQADSVYGQLAMAKNDDNSSNLLDLGFDANFFGTTYNNFYINNNGNITFNAPVSSFTPTAFPISSQPMIAPFWADVDTRCTNCGNVYFGAVNDQTTIVTWNDVGFFPSDASLTNNFQLVLRDQGAGNFDIEFRYDNLNWTTGGASGGTNGLGGTPAQAGFDAGNGTDFFALPGSFTNQVLDLQNTTNVTGGEAGLWSFAIREGATPGQTADNPLLPVIVDDSFTFDFNVEINETFFIDPVVAIGYDYVVTSGSNIASVLLPTGFGDNIFELLLWDGSTYVSAGSITGGVEHLFGVTGVDRFRIMGIESALEVDPTDPTAFVTGLTFVDAGAVSMTQTPITLDTGTGNGQVPEPLTLSLIGIGLAGLSLQRRNKRS